MEGYAVTHTGLVRKSNQDAFYYSENKVAAVFDGVGGAKFGEVASHIAAGIVENYSEKQSSFELLGTIQQAIKKKQETEPNLEGMATTAIVTKFKRGFIEFGWSGDSRLYTLKRTKLVQLTTDHTIAQDLVDRNVLTKEEAITSNISSHLTSCLSANEKFFKPSQNYLSFKTRKRFLVCSDGLTGVVKDEKIRQLLIGKPAKVAGEQLLRAALRAGAPDNVTIIVFDVPGKYVY